MKQVKVEEAKAGQKVAKDITDLKGMLLFKAGIELTDKILQRIKARNVSHVFIDVGGEGDGTSGSGIFKVPERVDEEVDRQFGETRSNPVMAALCEAVKEYHKARIK